MLAIFRCNWQLISKQSKGSLNFAEKFSKDEKMKVYKLVISDSRWNTQDERLMKVVSSKRSEQVKRFRYTVDQKLSLYSELLTMYALEKALGRPLIGINFSKTYTGKPFLAKEPHWHFNMSHSGRRVICGIANQSIGVDVEEIREVPLYISEDYFHEVEQLKLLAATSKEQMFYEIWTRKEAFVKNDGSGLSQNLKKINTYDLKKIAQFHSWCEKNYQYSVYTKQQEKLEVKDVTIDEVETYLLKK